MNIPRLLLRLLLGRRLPTTNGTLDVRGAKGPVLIRRDGHGIPYIEADEEDDAWYGVGFCQGQDRAFQLEGLLRVVRGTLSEIAGRDGLSVDRLSRRIGFLDSAERQLEVLRPESRAMLEAFAQGVAEGSRSGCNRAAHEFTILRSRPTPFSAADVLGVSKLQSFALASNWDVELARLQVLKEDGPEALAALDPPYPEWHPVSVPPGAPAGPQAGRLAEDLRALGTVVGRGGGSNNWAIAPSRTVTGRPILANDVHLAPTLPPQWYLAHVRTTKWAVAGATFVGGPVFPVGHNEVAAWGITAGMVDNTDLFLEELGPDGRSVREGDRFVPCELRTEVIHVKGGEDVVEEVVVTPRGPIIGPALGGGVGAISIRATWLDPRPVSGLLSVHRAQSFEEFRHAFEEWPYLSLNMVYADTAGVIGWQMVGEAPRRRRGWGTTPLPGWEPNAGWEDTPVPFGDMPHIMNPASGVVASANNSPAPDGEGPFLGVDWIEGYRAARIFESLESRRDWDVTAALALQMDQESIPWRELRDIVLAAPTQNHHAREALELLKAWDGVLAADSPAAAVFEFFLAELSTQIARAKAPRASAWAVGKGFTMIPSVTFFAVRRVGHLVRLLRDQPEGWFPEGWEQVVADALATATATLHTRYGDDRRRWAWGQVRRLTLPHPFGERALLRRAFNLGPFPWGGDANTIAQAAPSPSNPASNPLAIASVRMVVDVGKWEEGRFSLPGGQSGNPLSPHYGDLLPLWRRGEGVPIAWTPDEVEKAARSTLRLMPANTGPTDAAAR